MHPCSIDLVAATSDISSISHELPSDSSEFSSRIVHFYARLLVLKCYGDYYSRYDPEPIHLDESDRIFRQDHPHVLAIYYRRLELVKFKQDLFGHLGPSGSANGQCWRRLQSLLTDVEMLLSLYDKAVRIYEWHIHEPNSNYTGELASEQLEEAKQSKATAISLGKFSKFGSYIPPAQLC